MKIQKKTVGAENECWLLGWQTGLFRQGHEDVFLE